MILKTEFGQVKITRPDLYPQIAEINLAEEVSNDPKGKEKINKTPAYIKYKDGSEIRISNDCCSHCITKKLIDRLKDEPHCTDKKTQEKAYSEECYT